MTLAKYNAANLDQLMDRIAKNSIGMDEYLEQVHAYTEYGKLFVRGEKESPDEEGSFIHKGLAQRNFERSWTLADDTEVSNVVFEDGLLSITLTKVIPEHHQRKDYL
jgi:HSP20 family molecular chaperone IbpA